MNFGGLVFLLIAHYFTGKGILKLLRVQLDPVTAFCFSNIVGVVILSFTPSILQLMHLPIDSKHIINSIIIATLICSVPTIVWFRRPRLGKFELPKLYEWPYLAVFVFFIVISLWRCFYMPVFSRDMLSGPELLAEYAVREHNMISSVFNVDLSTTNNFFKSPYITSLQIIYKLLVCPFGQLWLSILFLSFTIWIFTLLRSRLHPLLACMALLVFITIPEMWAYTFVILYDYSNMIFFFSGFYFLVMYLENKRLSDFIFATFLFGMATYIRTESVILIAMLSPLLIYHYYKNKTSITTAGIQLAAFGLFPLAFWYLCIHVFIPKFIPVTFDLNENVNPHLSDLSPLFQRFKDIAGILIFSNYGVWYYGWFIYFFITILIIDVIWPRKFNKEAIYSLYGVAVIYVGLSFVGFLLPLADLQNTTKRGLFKAFPIMLLYMANSGFLLRLSDAIRNWELPKPAADKKKPDAVKRPAPAPIPTAPKGKKGK